MPAGVSFLRPQSPGILVVEILPPQFKLGEQPDDTLLDILVFGVCVHRLSVKTGLLFFN
jgi:hypothetical protein